MSPGLVVLRALAERVRRTTAFRRRRLSCKPFVAREDSPSPGSREPARSPIDGPRSNGLSPICRGDPGGVLPGTNRLSLDFDHFYAGQRDLRSCAALLPAPAALDVRVCFALRDSGCLARRKARRDPDHGRDVRGCPLVEGCAEATGAPFRRRTLRQRVLPVLLLVSE